MSALRVIARTTTVRNSAASLVGNSRVSVFLGNEAMAAPAAAAPSVAMGRRRAALYTSRLRATRATSRRRRSQWPS